MLVWAAGVAIQTGVSYQRRQNFGFTYCVSETGQPGTAQVLIKGLVSPGYTLKL